MTSFGLARTTIAAALLIGAFAGAAIAQDISQNPTYGTVNLRSGFVPDPHSISLHAGGELDASETIGGDCIGSVAGAPDVDLMFTAGALPLYISVTSEADTTLVVNGPDGEWYCNDDYGSFDPALTFGSPQSGLYNIWVGTYSAYGGLQPADLHISELRVVTEEVVPTKVPPQAGIDWRLPPNFGSVSLSSGFLPDPHVVEAVAGGNQEANTLGDHCRGWVSAAPDFNLTYDSSGEYDLTISAMSESDTTLVVRSPDGVYHCDDDGMGYPNPQLLINFPISGLYSIWVGRFGSENRDALADARLAISEIGLGPDDDGGFAQTGDIDWSLDPNFGSVTLTTGFLPDPHVVDIVAGGSQDASQLGDQCWGFVSAAPDYDVIFEAGELPLTFTATSQNDTVLVIRAPDGTYHCDDDGAGYPNPQVTFESPKSGLYDVWVGQFGIADNFIDALLAVSELGLGPDGSGGTVTSDVDWSLEPSYGTANLESGFLPDPHVVSVAAGGSQDASGLDFACNGFVATAPDYNLVYTAGDTYDLFISASSTADLTLVVNAPDGSWHCSDDYSGLNPGIEFLDPASGLYNIWVGTYSDVDTLPPSTLFISETQAHF